MTFTEFLEALKIYLKPSTNKKAMYLRGKPKLIHPCSEVAVFWYFIESFEQNYTICKGIKYQ